MFNSLCLSLKRKNGKQLVELVVLDLSCVLLVYRYIKFQCSTIMIRVVWKTFPSFHLARYVWVGHCTCLLFSLLEGNSCGYVSCDCWYWLLFSELYWTALCNKTHTFHSPKLNLIRFSHIVSLLNGSASVARCSTDPAPRSWLVCEWGGCDIIAYDEFSDVNFFILQVSYIVIWNWTMCC